jgi:hypothetical protein
MRAVGIVLLSLVFASAASAAVTFSAEHGETATSLNDHIAVGDLISGQIGVEQFGDNGWHPVNGDPLDKLPAFTDGAGILASGLTGLMNDYPTLGQPTKLVRYDLGGPKDIGKIGILTGNHGKDGRVFSTTVIRYSTNGGTNFNVLGYFQSDPSGTINAGTWGSTYVSVFDDASATLLAGVTNIEFDLYAVHNTLNEMRDPFDGDNPFTPEFDDDGLTAAFVSPLVFELDVITTPEPASMALLALGGLMLARRRKA